MKKLIAIITMASLASLGEIQAPNSNWFKLSKYEVERVLPILKQSNPKLSRAIGDTVMFSKSQGNLVPHIMSFTTREPFPFPTKAECAEMNQEMKNVSNSADFWDDVYEMTTFEKPVGIDVQSSKIWFDYSTKTLNSLAVVRKPMHVVTGLCAKYNKDGTITYLSFLSEFSDSTSASEAITYLKEFATENNEPNDKAEDNQGSNSKEKTSNISAPDASTDFTFEEYRDLRSKADKAKQYNEKTTELLDSKFGSGFSDTIKEEASSNIDSVKKQLNQVIDHYNQTSHCFSTPEMKNLGAQLITEIQMQSEALLTIMQGTGEEKTRRLGEAREQVSKLYAERFTDREIYFFCRSFYSTDSSGKVDFSEINESEKLYLMHSMKPETMTKMQGVMSEVIKKKPAIEYPR